MLRSRTIRLAASLPVGDSLRHHLVAALYPSALAIGDPVSVSVQDQKLYGHVRAILFTTGKIRYDVQVKVPGSGGGTTFKGVDSVFVTPNPEGSKVEYDFDNYA